MGLLQKMFNSNLNVFNKLCAAADQHTDEGFVNEVLFDAKTIAQGPFIAACWGIYGVAKVTGRRLDTLTL